MKKEEQQQEKNIYMERKKCDKILIVINPNEKTMRGYTFFSGPKIFRQTGRKEIYNV